MSTQYLRRKTPAYERGEKKEETHSNEGLWEGAASLKMGNSLRRRKKGRKKILSGNKRHSLFSLQKRQVPV